MTPDGEALAEALTILFVRGLKGDHPDSARYLHRVIGGFHVPDLTSPSELGCLVALYREAAGEPSFHLCPSRDDTTLWCFRSLWSWDESISGLTEGEVVAAALIARALTGAR